MSLRLLAGAFVAIIGMAFSVSPAGAQPLPPNLPGVHNDPGPQPPNNYAIAMAQGRQIVGFGGKCLQPEKGIFSYGTLFVMRDCDPKAIEQRFVAEGNRIRTAAQALVLAGDGFNLHPAWAHGCVTLTDQERLLLAMCGSQAIRPELQTWAFSGNLITGQGFCFDVYRDGTANGTPVLHYACHGGANQQWSWR